MNCSAAFVRHYEPQSEISSGIIPQRFVCREDALIVSGNTSTFNDATIYVSGAKNSILPAAVATLLLRGRTEIANVPSSVVDLASMRAILDYYGLRTHADPSTKRLIVVNEGVRYRALPAELSQTTRYSSLLIGALTGLFGRAKVGRSGGCNFKNGRPVDIHLDGLRALGVAVTETDDGVETLVLSDTPRTFRQRFPSVGATINLTMFLVGARQAHILENCATEPEVQDTFELLNEAGAEISGVGLPRLVIRPAEALTAVRHEIISDRIEIGTYALLAALIRRNVRIGGVDLRHVRAILDVLDAFAVPYEYVNKKRELLVAGREVQRLRPVRLYTGVYPGFPTDLQPIVAALCLKADGESEIVDTVFPHRFQYAEELRRMGADMVLDGATLKVRFSADRLRGAVVRCLDLRAGMACLFAALLCDGESILTGARQLVRGYDRLDEKLAACGIRIQRAGT
jgi:UDP-N-acetylglucosamine 1-carboxyvinyltransferase